MALASGVREYWPPKRIMQMEADLKNLASLWKEGPWGWSLATKLRYKKMGVDEKNLPDDEWLDNLRRLSSREWSCNYLHKLLKEIGPRCDEYFISADCLLGYEMRFFTEVNTETGDRIYKSLWSSSGRGIFTSDSLSKAHLHDRLHSLVNTQGGYVSDRFYKNKKTDFAMEFLIDSNGKVNFLGYSVFKAESKGTYQYNVVDSQQQLKKMTGVNPRLLDTLAEYHEQHLSDTGYQGYLGIDMLVTDDGRLHPVVEINFRMNMGILAMMIYERYGTEKNIVLIPEKEGRFGCKVENGRLMITTP